MHLRIPLKSTRESQSVYPLSDQNGAKTIPFWAAHTYQSNRGVLYSTANDPQPQMIPKPQMIPIMDPK